MLLATAKFYSVFWPAGRCQCQVLNHSFGLHYKNIFRHRSLQQTQLPHRLHNQIEDALALVIVQRKGKEVSVDGRLSHVCYSSKNNIRNVNYSVWPLPLGKGIWRSEMRYSLLIVTLTMNINDEEFCCGSLFCIFFRLWLLNIIPQVL